ncbi:MAG: hypothetical protein ACR2L1_08510 [Pyrinomonadaceae bacterium]
MTNNSTITNEKYPKINKFLVYAGTISNIVILGFFIAGMFSIGFLAYLVLNSGYVLLGLKEALIGKYMSAKIHDRLVGVFLLIGGGILAYDLIFNVLPNFKR